MSITIIGAGAFGTALAIALSANGPVTLWGRNINWEQENPRLPGAKLPDTVTITDDPDHINRTDKVLLALPAQVLDGFLSQNAARLDGKTLITTAKGIDLTHLTGPSVLIARSCPGATVAVLTGPSFAADIARGLPTALTLACSDPAKGRALQHALSTPTLRLYRTTDVIGAELGGALKNVIAIASGAVIGAGLGDSARAAIVTRGFAEMIRLSTRLGAQPETLTGLSGLGDLMLTCASAQSRNFRFGESIGSGQDFDPAITVEGAATAQAVTTMTRGSGDDLPIATMVARLAEGSVSVENAMEQLMSRPLKEE